MRFSTLATVSILAASALAAPARRSCTPKPAPPAPPAPTAAPAPPPAPTPDPAPPPPPAPTADPAPPPPPAPTADPPPPPPAPAPAPAGSGITADQITAIDGTTASCDGASTGAECGTAAQAAPFLSDSFTKYGTTSNGEKAALISLILFETGSFRYNINHFPEPGRPGQGTRNLMMFPGVWNYVQSIPELAAQATAIAPSADAANDDQKNQIRALVLGDNYTWASAAWYLSTCPQGIRDGLKSGSVDGWSAYISSCVGTTVTPERQAIWSKAVSVLGQ